MMGFGDAVASGGPYANNLHLTADITQNFYGPGALPDTRPTASEH